MNKDDIKTPGKADVIEIVEEGIEEISSFWKAADKVYLWLKNRALPFLWGAIAASALAFSTGCSAMAPQTRTQSMGVYALGLPAIAVITQTTQTEENTGSDTNSASQSNPVTVENEVTGNK